MTENKIVANNGSSIVLYTTDDGNTQLEVKLEKDTVWLTQNQMAELFGRDRTVIMRHIRNIFKEGELDENITCAKFAHMGKDADQAYQTALYNTDGTKRIADNTLVALTLMIAESRTEEKDVMVKIVVNLINKNNYE